jgi:hypothetical protein
MVVEPRDLHFSASEIEIGRHDEDALDASRQDFIGDGSVAQKRLSPSSSCNPKELVAFP